MNPEQLEEVKCANFPAYRARCLVSQHLSPLGNRWFNRESVEEQVKLVQRFCLGLQTLGELLEQIENMAKCEWDEAHKRMTYEP